MDLSVESASLYQPSLESVADVLDSGLRENFQSVTVKVVDCPDLTGKPYHLACEGLSGVTSIADVGGPPYLLPLAQTEKAQYDFKSIFTHVGLTDGGIIMGAGAGPHKDVGINCEMIANIAIKNGHLINKTNICKLNPDESGYTLEKVSSSHFSLLGNFYCSKGKPGKVLSIEASARIGKDSFITHIRKILASHYGDKPVGLGGVFLIERGFVKLHIMPKFSAKPLYTDEDVNNWLKFYEVPAPLVCVGELVSIDPGLDLRLEHFHCFSDHNDGGHYHYDVSPEEVVYRAFFNVAEKVHRIDRPTVTHNVGRD